MPMKVLYCLLLSDISLSSESILHSSSGSGRPSSFRRRMLALEELTQIVYCVWRVKKNRKIKVRLLTVCWCPRRTRDPKKSGNGVGTFVSIYYLHGSRDIGPSAASPPRWAQCDGRQSSHSSGSADSGFPPLGNISGIWLVAAASHSQFPNITQ